MKKFKFNLEAVLKYRQALQEQRERSFGEAGRKVNSARESLVGMRALFDQSYSKAAPGSEVNVTSILLEEQYRVRLTEEIEVKRQDVASLQTEFNNRRLDLTRATQAKEAIDTLKDQAVGDYQRQFVGEEQKLIDELSAQRVVPHKGKTK